MKKLSIFASALALMLCGTFTSCSVEDNATGDGGLTEVLDNGDALKKAVEMYGTEDGVLDLSESDIEILVIPEGDEYVIVEPTTIIGNGKLTLIAKNSLFLSSSLTLKNLKIDASELNAPLVKMDELPEGSDAVEVDMISFDGVTVEGLKNQLIYGNKQKYLIKELSIINSTINIVGAVKKTVIDFNGGGLPLNVTISNSTIAADEATQWQNGGLFSTQSGSRLADVTSDTNVTSTFTIADSKLTNIAKGKTTCTLRQNNQAWQYYVVTDNTITNCGKKGEFLVGIAAGRINKKENWTASGNTITFDGEDVGAAENTKSGIEGACIVPETPAE